MKRRRASRWLAVTLVLAFIPGLALGVRVLGPQLPQPGGLDWSGSAPRVHFADRGQVVVDARGRGRAISPYVYGVSFADTETLKLLGATVNRWGGNTATTYNWTNGCWNAARDWEFRNKPADEDPDQFVQATLAGGAVPLMTIPTIGWVSQDCNTETRSVGVPQHGVAPVSSGSSVMSHYDPAANLSRVYVPSAARAPKYGQAASPGTVYEDGWVRHMTERFGPEGGPRYYAMDNEPDLWAETHTDVRPAGLGYDESVRNFEEYSAALKDQNPSALVLGPDLSGWNALFYSGADRGSDNFRRHVDRQAHANQAFLPWWLSQVARSDREQGRRSLDLLDVHFYPQAGGVVGDGADARTQALRIRSVRGLDDPSYRDDSWIGSEVDLIPRLQQWIKTNYQGTGLAISEYNFGGQKDASGAVALAEALGIFGQTGVDLATYWTYPSPDTPAGAAFRLYRNFDGDGASFGDRSLPVASELLDVRAFASRQSSRSEVDVVLANESLTRRTTVDVGLQGAGVRSAEQFQVSPGSAQIQRTPLHSLRVTLPALGLSLVRINLL